MLENLFQKQIMMRRVVYSLVPIFLFSVYLYGWRVIVLAVINFTLGILTEFIMEKTRKKKVSEAVFITCMLYTLSLPPLVPFWISGIGIIFAVLFGKEVYGGFGRNIFNPAITGRLFIYISFPTIMTTGSWMKPGNFGTLPDAVTTATPIEVLRSGELPDLMSLVTGIRSGSIGESAIILIVLAGIYLIATKTANWRLIVSTAGSALLLSAVLFYAGVEQAADPLYTMLTGSILFVAVFMATDPVSAPKKQATMWLYGLLIGSSTVIIRFFSLFPEGTSFAILLGNMFAPLLDEVIGMVQKKKVAA